MAEAASAPHAVAVQLAHVTDGRARMRLTGRIPSEKLSEICGHLARLPGITRSLARPNTGSLIVESSMKKEALGDLLKSCDAIRIVPRVPSPPLGTALRFGLVRTDSEVFRRTGGQLNLHTALGALLMIAAVIQIARGRFVGPAATLLVNALALLESAGPKDR